jgi:hypothetical protein
MKFGGRANSKRVRQSIRIGIDRLIHGVIRRSPEDIGKVEHRVALVEIAIPLVETLTVRYAAGAGFTQPPLARNAGCVTCSLQDLGDGDVFLPQGNAMSFGGVRHLIRRTADTPAIVADARVTSMLTRH